MMKPNIYAIAGHNSISPGALGYDKITEHFRNTDLQKRILNRVKSAVALCGTSMNIISDDEQKSNASVRELINATAGPGSRGIDIHFNNNAPGASGTEVVIHPKTSPENRARAEYIVREISRTLGIPIRRREPGRDFIYPSETHVGSIAIIEQVKIPIILVEVCFLNSTDLPRYLGKEDAVAEILINALLNKFLLK